MPLYLGSEKVDFTISKVSVVDTGAQCATGTVVVDDDDTVTFPCLDFTPTLIALWNISSVDLKAQVEENGEEWDDAFIRYVHKGVMLFAVCQDGEWYIQSVQHHSSGSHISGESWDGMRNKCVKQNNGVYSYKLNHRGSGEFTGETFHYAIYGK